MRRFYEAALCFAHGFTPGLSAGIGNHDFKEPVRARTPNDADLLAMLSLVARTPVACGKTKASRDGDGCDDCRPIASIGSRLERLSKVDRRSPLGRATRGWGLAASADRVDGDQQL